MNIIETHQERAGQCSGFANRDGEPVHGGHSLCGLDAAAKIAKGESIMTTGRELYGSVGAKEPILFDGKLGWINVSCQECGVDYDIREISNESTHRYAKHVAIFDCPRGHHCEARRVFTEMVA